VFGGPENKKNHFKTNSNMKNLILFSAFIAFFLLAGAQNAQAQRNYEDYNFGVDTLRNQDTIIQEFQFLFKRPFFYSVQIQADSISGANQGFAYLEVSNDPQSVGRRWHRTQTLTIDGPGTDAALYEGVVYARRMRVYYISPSGTRRVAVKTNATFKAYSNY